ncbi:MAG: ester cyclase [Actinomycetota bacterium]|nr:ester cyclase [Actinomycetota bacterium]
MTDLQHTAQEPATLMQKAFEAIAAQDLEALGALQHDELVDDFIVLGPVDGKPAVLAFFAELFAAFPNTDFTIERVMAVDDSTAVGQWSLRGDFSGGPFQGIQPTGRPVAIRGIDVMEFEDGLLRHNTIYYDGLQFARQIGLLPPEGSRRDRALLSTFNTATKAKTLVRRK